MSGMIDLDLTGVGTEPEPFEVEDEGQHVLTVADVQVKPPKKEGGKPTVGLKFQTENEKQVWDWINLHEGFLWKMRSFLEAAYGQTVDGPLSVDPKDLIGRKVGAVLSVGLRTDPKAKEGEKTNKVESYFAL
jgi:hypothetical protein